MFTIFNFNPNSEFSVPAVGGNKLITIIAVDIYNIVNGKLGHADKHKILLRVETKFSKHFRDFDRNQKCHWMIRKCLTDGSLLNAIL